jgi:hypothetical protein
MFALGIMGARNWRRRTFKSLSNVVKRASHVVPSKNKIRWLFWEKEELLGGEGHRYHETPGGAGFVCSSTHTYRNFFST